MKHIEFHSHEQQDEFIFNLFGQKTSGTFLDISCGNPIIGSNSYTLEKYNGWRGIGFDIGDAESLFQWSQKRQSKFVQMDATSAQLTEYLAEHSPKLVDYISLDVDAAGTNLALPALQRVLDSGIRFKAMTFEHEYYIHGDSTRALARELLEKQGYVRLFEDVRLWSGGLGDDRQAYFEDWWIDPEFFDQRILEISNSGLYYFDCVQQLKELLGNTYIAQHNCSRAWPNEYRLHWHEQEKQELAELFLRMSPRP